MHDSARSAQASMANRRVIRAQTGFKQDIHRSPWWILEAMAARLGLWQIALGRPLFPGLCGKIGKPACRDGGTHAGHQVLVVVQVHHRQKRTAERFTSLKKVMQVCAREIAGGRTPAFGVERPRIASVLGIFDVDRAETREREAMAAVAR